MRVLLLVLCLLFSGCGQAAITPDVEEPKQPYTKQVESNNRVYYDLGVFPPVGIILPLPKGFYGYVTIKDHGWDTITVVCSKQYAADHYLVVLNKDDDHFYHINDHQYIRVGWLRRDGEVVMLVEGFDTKEDK